MNVEIGTEAALFPEKEYIDGIFLAVWITWLVFFQSMVLMAGPGYMSMRLWWG
jgi:hypothetical protein